MMVLWGLMAEKKRICKNAPFCSEENVACCSVSPLVLHLAYHPAALAEKC